MLKKEQVKPREEWLGHLRDVISKREAEVLPLLLDGKTNPEIGIILGISSRTVEKHVSAILESGGVENRKALMAQLHSALPN